MGFSTRVVVEDGCGTEWSGPLANGLVCYRQETVVSSNGFATSRSFCLV